MSQINLTGEAGKAYENVVVPDDVYVATLKSVEDKPVMVNSKFGNKSRLIIRWEITTPSGVKELPQFLNLDVRKGSGTYANTSSYDLISKAGLVQDFATLVGARTEIGDAETIAFLKTKLVGKKGKVYSKTKQRNDLTQYSVVKEIVSFI